MTSRLLNIFVIKSRSRPKPTTLPPPFTQAYSAAAAPRITQYTITINPTTRVILRGLSTDLYALTTTIWLRPKTHVEGYLEATAKVLVYLVAAVSGNATQAGNLILLSLLLASAGLLALSNARVTGLRTGGKVVTPSPPSEKKRYEGGGNDGNLSGGGDGGGDGVDRLSNNHHYHHDQNDPSRAANGGPDQRSELRQAETDSWPETSESSSMAGLDGTTGGDGRAGNVHRATYLSDDSVAYEVRLEEGLRTTPAKTRRR